MILPTLNAKKLVEKQQKYYTHEELLKELDRRDKRDQKFPFNVFRYIRIKKYALSLVPNNIKSLYQRIFNKVSDNDVFSSCYYLADLIPTMIDRMVEQLKTIPSHPSTMTFRKWKKTLLFISKGFKLKKKELDYYELNKKEKEQMAKGMKMFIEHFDQLWV